MLRGAAKCIECANWFGCCVSGNREKLFRSGLIITRGFRENKWRFIVDFGFSRRFISHIDYSIYRLTDIE